MTTATAGLTLRCDSCRLPVTGRRGYVCVDLDDVFYRCPQAAKIEWHVFHRGGCDPAPDRNYYWFPVDRCSTPMDLLSRLAHLERTTEWFASTDWPALIESVLLSSGWRGRP